MISAYREITFAGALAGLSVYFVDRWLRDIHPYRVSIYARLMAIACVKDTPSPSLADLAASIRALSEEAVRKYFVRWWLSDQSGDPEWDFFRAAVQIVERPGRTYQFRDIVLDDILHPDDLALLDERVSHFRDGSRQGALVLPTPTSLGDRARLDFRPVWNFDLSGTQTGQRMNPSETQTGSPLPPSGLPPSVPAPAHEARPGTSVLPAQRLAEPADPRYPLPAAVPGLLAELGVSQPGIRKLLKLPMGAYWAARWCVWIRSKSGIRDLGGFLFSRIWGACHGNPDDQEPPLAWIAEQERLAQRRKSLERTRSVVATRPRAVVQRREPRSETAIIPELEPVWRHLRETTAGTGVESTLATATAVLLEGNALVIELPGGMSEFARRRRDHLLELTQSVRPDIADVRFATKGGR